ncbi:MAG: uroporphyrinogen-III synthase [Proteobacteria bacterium]|nr:uroporphyrinogen-III synthase [Pseudomonadota bacterium]MDA1351511.1 uroporphyrinogen-III synthase [Pseudomonadota bacterium]
MKANRLFDKRVLVVRPLRRQDDFLLLLEKCSASVIHTPIMTIEPMLDCQQVKQQILAFDQFDIAIFVSVNAAEIGITWLDQYWPMLPTGMEYFALGGQTARVVGHYTQAVNYPTNQITSEGLLALSQLQNLDNKSVIIFRGGPGRETLKQALNSRGARVEYCDLYRRVVDQRQVEVTRQQLTEVDCLVVHSAELLEAIGPISGFSGAQKVRDLPLVVPSDRVAGIAKSLGYNSITVADSAMPESMYGALQKVF